MIGNKVVAKFGGSSVKDAKAMWDCVNIIKNNSAIKVAVISATYNTTNQLEQMAIAATTDLANAKNLLQENKNRHLIIANELKTSEMAMGALDEIYEDAQDTLTRMAKRKKVEDFEMDQLYSVGERVSSLMFADLLSRSLKDRDVMLADAREFIKTNGQFKKAQPDVYRISEKVLQLHGSFLESEGSLMVTQGFIGSQDDDWTTTLGREGSDYTATLIGEAISADLVQIWTDVPGVAVIDPKLWDKAPFLPKMNYQQAGLMAQLGSKVLFPDTLAPAMRKNIPVFVGKTSSPEIGGTLIKSDENHEWGLTVSSQVKTDQYSSKLHVSLIGLDNHSRRSIINNTLRPSYSKLKIVEESSKNTTLEIDLNDKVQFMQIILDILKAKYQAQ